MEELRVRLANSLKRHFHAKRADGLLSGRATRVLDTACDEAIDEPAAPLRLWEAVERDVTARWASRALALAAYWLRRAAITVAGDSRGMRRRSLTGAVRRGAAWPLSKAARALLWALSRLMLTACEAAMEMMQGLACAPGAVLAAAAASGGSAATTVAAEVDAQLAEVWLFLHDREAEAPERFQAIQTYRATAAALRRQAAFVSDLYESGAVDADERDALARPLAAREAALERTGPTWRAPSPADVLRDLPFARSSPDIAPFLLARGALRVHRAGALVAESDGGGADDGSVHASTSTAHPSGGFIVVISGLVRVTAHGRAGDRHDVYMGCGGVVGRYTALTGESWGAWAAVAEGSTLGRGPLVLHVPQAAVDALRARSAAGEPVFQQVEVDMWRMAALFVVELEKARLLGYLGSVLGRGGEEGEDGGASTPRPSASSSSTIDAEYRVLVRGLAAAELVELPPGTAFHLRSSAVLMRGSVSVSACVVGGGVDGEGDGGRPPSTKAWVAPAGSDMATFVYAAPALLPWLGLEGGGGGKKGGALAPRPGHARLVAGEAGAALMVTPWAGAAPVTHASCLDLASLGAAEVSRMGGSGGGGSARGGGGPAKKSLLGLGGRAEGAAASSRHRITRAAPMDGVGAASGGLAHTVPRLVRTSLTHGLSVVKKGKKKGGEGEG